MRKPLFIRDREADSASDDIYVYRYMRWTSNALYVLFTKRGVEFILSGKEKIRNSSSIMNLSLALDNDQRDMLSSSLNAIYLIDKESAIWADLDMTLDEGYHKVGYECDGVSLLSEKISRRRVFLDFVYEFEQGNVFRQDPLFEITYSTLHKHHLFNAIVSKLEYNDERQRFAKKWNDILKAGDCKDELTQKEYKIDLRILAGTERRWVETIVNPQSEMVFHESVWFNANEDVGELDDVYLESFTLESGKLLDEQNDKDSLICEVIRGTTRMSARWYMSKYRLDGVLKIRLGENSKFSIWAISIYLVILTLLGGVYGFIYENIKDSCFWRTAFMIIAIAASLLMALSYVIPSIYQMKRRHLCRSEILPNIIMPRLFASIAAGWMTVGLSDLVIEGQNHDYHNYAGLLTIIIPVLLLVFIWLSVRKIHPYAKSMVQWVIAFIVFCISMIYSILIGALLLQIYSGRSYFFGCDVDAWAPKTLLVFAYISMFVGIFIQMLFNGKSITSIDN